MFPGLVKGKKGVSFDTPHPDPLPEGAREKWGASLPEGARGQKAEYLPKGDGRKGGISPTGRGSSLSPRPFGGED